VGDGLAVAIHSNDQWSCGDSCATVSNGRLLANGGGRRPVDCGRRPVGYERWQPSLAIADNRLLKMVASSRRWSTIGKRPTVGCNKEEEK